MEVNIGTIVVATILDKGVKKTYFGMVYEIVKDPDNPGESVFLVDIGVGTRRLKREDLYPVVQISGAPDISLALEIAKNDILLFLVNENRELRSEISKKGGDIESILNRRGM